MPSSRHELLARVVPKLRKSRELDSPEAERARLERWHATLDRGFPTRAVPLFDRRYAVVREELPGSEAGPGFPAYTLTRRGTTPNRTVVYCHGGGFVGPIDPYHVRYAARLASGLGVRVVLPDYPLTPEHTWHDSHEPLVGLVQRLLADTPGGVALAGDSAGGGLALSIALTLRDRGGPQPSHLLLVSPWVDLTTSTPETLEVTEDDPWLFIGKMRAYAEWWAGSAAEIGRPEVSPALGDLAGLPPALMFFGTRDSLWPGGRLLVRRAAEAGWQLRYVEEPGLLHVYPILPFIPEARRAWRTTKEFLA
ncbi:MAG TPA: alpha/beta hydrolase [Nocardioides sp.]|uniref:alpha/beta hydrolase n=1 Tax=uncultured Nocardioides sp. TaxID=198441 RepID=UPI00262C0822|nr:alpha/beta hydrolase [uncultured Nocardioides sp.]HRD63338.1 alpha/beta hydrolase [Nocardioides sp.]HRI96528.1 alpha/beta hydrolase [Nocardioides sp.]